MAKDYYAILGVDRSASDEAIKKAFRRLAHEHHPDKSGGNETKFKELNEAYQVLSNPEKRKRYDQFGSADEHSGGGFHWQGANQGGPNPFGGFGGFTQDQTFDFGDIGDILGDFFSFGGSGETRRSRQQRGNDLETTLPLTFEESYFGAEKELSFSTLVRCEHCSGKGFDPASTITTCTRCKGAGRVAAVQSTMLGTFRTEVACPDCEGTGKKADKKCTVCHGETRIKQNKTLEIKIPAGIDASQSIRLAGKGEAGLRGAANGDIFVKLTIGPHPIFARDGYDIAGTEEIPLSILAAGGTVNVRTMTGEARLKIPAGTKSGTTFNLKNKGFERLQGRGRGDQRITIHVQVPESLTKQQKKLLQEFENSIEM